MRTYYGPPKDLTQKSLIGNWSFNFDLPTFWWERILNYLFFRKDK